MHDPHPEHENAPIDFGSTAADGDVARRMHSIANHEVEPLLGDRLASLDAAVESAVESRFGSGIELASDPASGPNFGPTSVQPGAIPHPSLRFRAVARWMARAAAIAITCGAGVLFGWQRGSHVVVDPALETGVVVAEGPITILDAFTVARIIAQRPSATVPITALSLRPEIAMRLDIDGSGTLDGADIDLLIDAALRDRGDR